MTDMRPTLPDLSCDDVRELAASYVLGALDEDEADAVRAHLASCADPHAEMAELGSVVAVLTEVVPVVEPSPALKGRIMAAAAADLEARRGGARTDVQPTEQPAVSAPVASPAVTAPVASPAEPVPFPTSAEREQRAAARAGMGSWVLRIAAVLAIALLGGWNLLLQSQLDAARTYEQNVAAVLDVAGQPGSLTAILTGEGADAPAGLAAIASDGSVRIAMSDLPATSGNQVYQAWVIGGDGVPKALGGFQVGATGVAYFEGSGLPTQEGIVLALTLEPGPGATAPSSAPVSAGTAVAAAG
jgi:anti-sigma-K factor RskA